MLVNAGEGANGGQIIGRDAQHGFELSPRVVKLPELDERAPERHLRRQVSRMTRQPFAADRDRLLIIPSASCANAIDAGSFSSRRRSASMRGLSFIPLNSMLACNRDCRR